MVTKATAPSKRTKKLPRKTNSPGRPTSKELAKRKVVILDIATALFLEDGYAATSLVDIAKHAGVATRTIYQHYGDKEAIFRAVVDRRIEEKGRQLPPINTNQKLSDVLVEIANYINAVSLSQEAIPFQRLLIAESNRFPELMGKIFEEQYQAFHNTITNVFQQLADAGKIPPDNHSKTAIYFNDLMHGISPLNLILSGSRSPPPEVDVREKVALFIAGRFGLDPKLGGAK